MSDRALETTTPVNNDNLTSILHQLENNYYGVEAPDFEKIRTRIREFTQFLNTTILGIVVSGQSKYNKQACNEISKVQRVISMIHKQAKKRNKALNIYPMQCRVCDLTIVVKDKRDFWGQLRQHEHFEQLWANYLVGGREAVESEVGKGPVAMERATGEVPWRETVLNYDRTVSDFCYPMDFMRQVYFADGVPEFTMQFRGIGTSCLLCNIPATLTGSSLMDHMYGSRHRTRSKEVLRRAALSNYHVNFSKLPPNQQAHMIYFTTKRLEEIRCRLCKQTVKYTELEEHIFSENHRDAIITRLQKNSTARQEPLLYKARTVYYADVNVKAETSLQAEVSVASTSSFLVTFDSPNTTINGSEDEDKPAEDEDKPAEEEDKPAEFKFNFSIPQEEESAVTEPENVPNPTIVSPPQEQTSESISYDSMILEVTYPERIRTLSHQIDNVPYYTIQVLSESECCCLLCRCGLEGRMNSIKTHLRGLKHQRNTSVAEVYISLKEYHIGFMRLPIQLQPHVIYFWPSTQKKARCKLCGDSVMYGAPLEAHIFGNTHRIGVLKRMQYGMYHVKDTLLKRALKIYPGENGEKSDENGGGSSTMNGVVEVTKSGATSAKRHDIVTSITNQGSLSFFDRLENRFRSHLNLLEERSADIYCKCCNLIIMKTRYEVKKHIISEEHKKKAGVPNKRYKYVCDVCTLTQRKEATWQEHFHSEPHNRRLEEIPAVKREHFTEYECRTCNVIIFGDTVALRKHRSFIRNRQNAKFRKEITLNEHVKLLFKSEDHINALSAQLVSKAKEVVEHQDNVWTCCKAIEVALSKVFENCRAYPFGSRVSGLGNMNSDLDVFVDVGDMYLGQNNQDAKSQERIVKDAAKVFRKFPGRVFTHINPVPTARTPIVQIFHTVTQLDCDLSFRHGLSVENTKFLRVCIGLQPITQHLILMLKQWSQFSKLDENITTYALSMMSIFYLQTRGFLLSVKQLKTLNPEPPQIIDGWETINYSLSFEAMKAHITPFTGTLKELLSDFFKYYFEFKFETEVVCPLLGHTIKKSDFTGSVTGDLLPPEMNTYIVKLRTEEEPELFRALSPLCVQDPFDLSHNLTKACSDYVVEKFQTLCDLSAKYLASVN